MRSLETFIAAMEEELLNACLREPNYGSYMLACKKNTEAAVIKDKAERAKDFNDDPEYLKLYTAYKELKKCLQTSQTSEDS